MRIRTIKPEFFLHERLCELNAETRLAFIGLWCAADREGRFEWRPKRLKVQILPWENVDFAEILETLADSGFIIKYQSGKELYGFIPSFADHQRINCRESKSAIPEPSEHDLARARTCTHMQDNGEGNKEGKGRERRVSKDTLSSSDDGPSHQSSDFQEEIPLKIPKNAPERVVEIYHQFAPSLPKVQKLTPERRKAINSRFRQYKGDWLAFEILFEKAEASDFLSGRNGRWTSCNFDWLINSRNMTKVLEKTYDNPIQKAQ